MSRQLQPRRNHAAVGVGKKLYVWGGNTGDSTKIPSTTLENFDVSSLTWGQPQRLDGFLPDGLWGMAITSDGEDAYTFGGRTGSYPKCTYFNTLYYVNPSTLQCRELVPGNPSQAPKKASGCRMVHFNGKLVVHGGYTGGGRTDQLHVFDLKTSECGI